MPTTGAAAVFTGPGTVEVREIPVPDPGPGEVLLRTEVSLISNGTERWIWSGRFHSPGKAPPFAYPVVPGYQRVGRVAALGSGVSGLAEGERVFATISRLDPPYAAFSGSHAEYGVTPAAECLPLPDSIASTDAAGLVLTQVGFNGGTRPPVHPGDVTVVIGEGLVGQWAAQAFRARGAHVILCGRHPRRLEIGAEHSADEVLDTSRTDMVATLRERFPNGVAIVDEAVGLLANVEAAFRIVRHDGHIVFNGYHPEGEHLMSIQWMHDLEVTCWGMAGWTRPRLEGTLGLLAEGRMRVSELITHEFPGCEADRAYRLVWDRSEEFLGIALHW